MCETLLALGDQCEESKEEDKAVEAYERVLKMEPNHEKAKDAIYNLRGLAKDAEDLGIDIKSFKADKEMMFRFKEFIQLEKAKKEAETGRASFSPGNRMSHSRSKSPIAARSGSAGRSVSPFSQKVSLVNPTTLLAPGAIDPSIPNIVEEEQPKRQAKWDIPPDNSTIGAAQPVSQKTTGSAGPSVPFVPDPQQLDFSVPPPNFYPGHQAPPATLVTQVSQKSDADIEWEKKMAEFVQKTKPDRPKRDDLDAKINEHLNKSTPPSSSSKSGKKRRTFTDYPVTDEPIASKVSTSNSARGSDDRDVDLRVKIDKISDAKTKTSDKDQKTDNKDMVVYNERTGMYQRTEKGLSSERIVKKLSKSPSPPQKRRSRSPRRSSRSPKRSSRSPNRSRSARKSRSRSRSRDRHPRQSRDRRDHRSRSRDRHHKRSRSRDRSPRGRRSSRSPGRGRSSGRRPRSLSRSPRRSPVGLTIGRDQFGRDKKRSSRSPPPSRKRSRSPQSRRDSGTPPHKKVLKEYSSSKRKSDGGDLKGTNLDSWKKETVEDLISETDKMRKEREKIKKEKEKLVSGGDLQSGMMWNIGNSLPCPVKNSLPVPVPTRSSGASSNPEPPEASSASSNSKKERKEIVMKVKQSAKVQEDKKWEVEDEEDDELLVNEAMESVKKAVDSPAGNSQKPAGKLDPKIASKILPGAKNFQDVEKWMEKQKKERMDQLKKKNNWETGPPKFGNNSRFRTRVCKFHLEGRGCRDGDKCNFRHDQG